MIALLSLLTLAQITQTVWLVWSVGNRKRIDGAILNHWKSAEERAARDEERATRPQVYALTTDDIEKIAAVVIEQTKVRP